MEAVSLYAHWVATVENTPDARALRAQDEIWTFAELQCAVEAVPLSGERYREVRGRGASFVIGTLAAWRDDAILVPCESEQAFGKCEGIGDEICHIKHTSGSTGAPRAIGFTAAQLKADVDQIVSTMGLRSDWPNLGVISLAHSYGFSNLVLPLLLHGIPLVLVPDALPGSIERALAEEEAVTLAAVPAMWRAWLGAGVLDDHVRLAISAGAPLTSALERAVYEETGIKIHNFYGSSECGGIAYDRTAVPRADGGEVGTALDGVCLSLDEGCLQIESPAVAAGYADSQPTDLLGNGKFQTTDQAEINDDGCVFLRGRQGDAINVAGRKVAPQTIEEVISSVEGVQCAVVFGVPSPDEERVDEIVACVSLKNDVALESVKIEASAKLSPWQRPRLWWDCPELVPDVRGKLSRAHWRQRYQEFTKPKAL